MKKVWNKFLKLSILFLTITAFFTISCNAETNNWKEWQKREYWEWHTRTTESDKAYNGEHISIENDKINFYGYGVISYKDFLYKKYKNPGEKTFSFKIDESKANYHTLDGAGIMFNSNISNNKFTGYILLFKQNDIVLYRLENIDIKTLEEKENSTIETYGTVITKSKKDNTGVHNIVVKSTPTNIIVNENNKELINKSLDYSKNVGNDFGLISSYMQHDCSKLSKIQFSEFEIKIQDYTFEILNTDMENKPLYGGELLIKDTNGKKVQEGKFNSKGIFLVQGMQPGKYIVKQTKAQDGYEINSEEYSFIVSNDGKILDSNTNKEIQLVIKNNKKITKELSEEKKNEDNTVANKKIPNAGFKKVITLLSVVILIMTIFFIRYNKYKIIK